MTTWFYKALYARLTGTEAAYSAAADIVIPALPAAQIAAQDTLKGLLATDPDTKLPFVARGNTSDQVLYPMIAYRPSPGVTDRRFGPSGSVDNPILDMEIWDSSGNDDNLTDIAEAVHALMDMRAPWLAPQMLMPGGEVAVWIEPFVTESEWHDNNRHAWFLLMRSTRR